jgi:8-amino-7-oxononanoate synthase
MLADKVQQKLDALQQQHLIRHNPVADARDGNHLTLDDARLINFSSTDYLSLGNHPEIKKAFFDAIDRYGFGCSASAQVSGYSREHQQLEEKLAEFLNRDKALVFNSGYHANLGLISAIISRHDHIFSDKYSHASLIDAIKLSGAKHHRYGHQDLSALERLLKQHKSQQNYIVTESVFNTQGNITDVRALVSIAKTRQASIVLDDTHGLGVLGKSGAGISAMPEASQDNVPFIVASLGKAFASVGGVVAGNQTDIEYLAQTARPYRYSTALPPAIAAASLASLSLIQQENWRRERLADSINHARKCANDCPYQPLSHPDIPVVSLMIGDNERLLCLQTFLKEAGFFVAAFRSPTVPAGTERLSIFLNCGHTEAELTSLFDRITEYHESH